MIDKNKTKELDCWKKLTGETSEHFVTALQFDDEESYKEAVRYFKESFEFALTQQRTELLDEQFEKSETEAEIASKAYDQGYLDCQKGKKKSPHDTREGYCCACDYDLVCFEGKLKEARTELLEEIKTRIDTWGGFEDGGGNLCHYDSEILEWVNNLLNNKDD